MNVSDPDGGPATDRTGMATAPESEPIGYSGPSSAQPYEVPNAPAGRLDWAVIAVRLLAIWSLFSAAPLLLSLPYLFSGDPYASWGYRLSILFAPALSLGVGIALWAFAPSIGRRMLGDVPPVTESTPPAPHQTGLTVADVQPLCFSIVGVALAVLALRHLPQAFVGLEDSTGRIERTGVDRRYMFQFVLEAAAAAGLFFGARGLSNIWQRVRAGPDAPHVEHGSRLGDTGRDEAPERTDRA